MSETRKSIRRSSTLWSLLGLVAWPIGLGLLAGYAVHYYQASQIREDFSPYRSAGTAAAQTQAVKRAFSYIARPMNVDFGQIENYKRYRTDWDIVNSGLKPLEIELVSKTCDVEFDGVPMTAQSVLGSRIIGTLAMSWVAANSDKEFHHEVVLKTNDDVQSRQELRFQVHGTVNRVLDILPPTLDFGALAKGESKSLTAQVLCYQTKTFSIEGFSFSDESLRPGFTVKIEKIEDLTGFEGDRKPAAGFSVTVLAEPDKLEKRAVDTSLALRCNLPQVEGLAIGLHLDAD